MVSCRQTTSTEECLRYNSTKVKRGPRRCLGKKSTSNHSPLTLTGETSTALTMSHGTRTNTSLSTADHAGLKDLPHLLQTDLTSFWVTKTPPLLLLTPRLSLTAELVALATVVTPQVSTTTLIQQVSLIQVASNTLLKMHNLATPLTFAEIAHGLLLLRVMTDSQSAGL